MVDFNTYMNRHGECWVWDLLKGVEKVRGLTLDDGLSLEQRWDYVMNDAALSVTMVQQQKAA